MITLNLIQVLKNYVVSTAVQHHLDENFDVKAFGNNEIKDVFSSQDKDIQAALTKLKSKVQYIAPGFFSQGKAIYVMMHMKSNPKNPELAPDKGLLDFSKLIKNALLGNPDSLVDMASQKSIVVANASYTDDPEKIDNYYFAGFKLKI